MEVIKEKRGRTNQKTQHNSIIRVPVDEVGGGLAHDPRGEERRHLQGQRGAQRRGGVPPSSLTS